MPKYVLAYRSPKSYAPGQPDAVAAWNEFRANLGDKVVDFGNPVFEASNLGTCDDTTRLGGYSFITADDLESAVALAKGSPVLAAGGGVEVGEITLAQMLHEWALHDIGHIRQVAELVRARKYLNGAGPLGKSYQLKPWFANP